MVPGEAQTPRLHLLTLDEMAQRAVVLALAVVAWEGLLLPWPWQSSLWLENLSERPARQAGCMVGRMTL
jgi:hypothetical protein